MKNNWSDKHLCNNHLSERWLLLGVLFFSLVAIFLRLYRLDGPGLWEDEIFTFELTSLGTLAEMLEEVSWEKTNPRLHYIAMWALFKEFGMSVWVGRGFSALAGVLGVAAMYFLGRRMFNREVGLYAMALCAMCYHHLAISQDARPYAFVFLFSTLSFLFFIAVLQELKWRYLAGHVIFSALLIHTHYFGLLVLAAEALLFVLYCVFNWQQLDRRIFLFAGATAFLLLLACLPLYSLLSGAAGLDSHWTVKHEVNSSFLYIFISYIHFFGSSLPLAAVISLAIFFGVLIAFSRAAVGRRHRFYVLCLLVWPAVIFGVAYLYTKLAVPIMHYRYFTAGLPPLLLLAAWGLYLAGVKYALMALLIAASGIAENMVFTKRENIEVTKRHGGLFSPEKRYLAYQITYPRDREQTKLLLQRLASYDAPAYIYSAFDSRIRFFEKVFDLPNSSIGGHADFKRHLQGEPKKFWLMKMHERNNRALEEIENEFGILQRGYRRGPEINYKRALARQYLPACSPAECSKGNK